MRKLLLALALLVALASAQIDARTRAYIHAMLADSAEVMRATVSDTADVVRSTVRGEFADSVDGVSRTIDEAWIFDSQVLIDGDTLIFTDGGADSTLVFTGATYHRIHSDINLR